jgi:hypothetical protein
VTKNVPGRGPVLCTPSQLADLQRSTQAGHLHEL